MASRWPGGRGAYYLVKRTTFFSILVLVLLFFSASISFAQVHVHLRVIRASNAGWGVDPSLRDVHKELGSLFSFTSYRLLRDEALNLSLDRPVSISARGGRIIIETTLVGLHRDVAELKIRVVREGKNILDTQVRLFPGRTVLIGGPKHREGGVIIYALSAH